MSWANPAKKKKCKLSLIQAGKQPDLFLGFAAVKTEMFFFSPVGTAQRDSIRLRFNQEWCESHPLIYIKDEFNGLASGLILLGRLKWSVEGEAGQRVLIDSHSAYRAA